MTPIPRSTYRSLIGPLFLPAFFTAVFLGIAEPVMPLYLQSAGASYAVVGTVVSALEVGRLLAALPGSGILTRFSMRSTMLAGSSVLIMALLTLAFVNTIPVIFAAWLLAGLGLTLYELARHQFIATHIANQQRGRSVSIIGGIFRLSNVIGPAIGGWVAQHYGFYAPFLLMAGCAALATAVIFIAMPPQPKIEQPFSLHAYSRELWQTWRHSRRILLVAGGGQLMMQLVRRTRAVIIPLYAANILGLDVVQVGLVISIGSVLDTLLFIPTGYIVDQLGRKMAIIPSLLLQSVGLLLLPLTSSFALLAGVSALMGFGNGISAGTMITLGADLAPPEQRTPFLGLWRISSSLGFALGPNIVGSVATLLTLPLASVTAGGIGLLAAALFYRFVPETLVRSETVPVKVKA